MLATLYYLSGFNNYFNRQVKKPSSTLVSEYEEWVAFSTRPTNFNPNNNVSTSISCNYPDGDDTIELDYMLVSVDNVNIQSRWYVVDRKRNLAGQWELTLKRDLIADCFADIVSSPVYIEKATVNVNNPLIYNSENFSVNQIKKSEFLLKDSTGTPWIVMYVDRNQAEAKSIKTRANVIENSDLLYEYNELRDLIGTEILGATVEKPIVSFIADYYDSAPAGGRALGGSYIYMSDGDAAAYNQRSGYSYITHSKYIQQGRHPDSLVDTKNQFNTLVKANENELTTYLYATSGTSNQQSTIDELKVIQGRTVKDADSDTYYIPHIEIGVKELKVKVPKNSGLWNNLDAGIMNIPYIVQSYEPNNQENTITLECKVQYAVVKSLEVVEGIEIQMVIPAAANRNSLTDAPWDMLAIPYNEVWVRVAGGKVGTLPNVARAIAQAAFGDAGDFIKDVQLLPYCPCMEYCANGELNVSNLTNGLHYSPITSPGEQLPVGYGIWCNQSTFSVNIVGFDPISVPLDAVEFKIQNECDMYRLCAPNYSSAFEFSATKNNGIAGFEANCTYKPLQPYIHVNPIFGGLYGKDFNDNRGLVCAGNYSMASTKSAWTDYITQNKAYKESFDRQIENMETTHNIQLEQQKTAAVIQGITGVVSGAGSGAMLGGTVGGPYGMVAGAAVGAGASLAANVWGAQKDIEYTNRLYEESKSYATDRFNLSLQNIKAMPNTVHNVGAFDINYKYFPFLEYYSCTDVEKEILRSKLKYNGFTINAIGCITDYITGEDQFIQGQLIRYLGDEDYHEVAEIANELHKGVWM